jgi:hypothetical protein
MELTPGSRGMRKMRIAACERRVGEGEKRKKEKIEIYPPCGLHTDISITIII